MNSCPSYSPPFPDAIHIQPFMDPCSSKQQQQQQQQQQHTGYWRYPVYGTPNGNLAPKVTIVTQPPLSADLDTPSSTSSYPLSTPESPLGHDFYHDNVEMEELEYDDDEECDSDYVDEFDREYSPHSPPVIINTESSLAGALGNYPRPASSGHDGHSSAYSSHPFSDRKMSASAPGHAHAPDASSYYASPPQNSTNSPASSSASSYSPQPPHNAYYPNAQCSYSPPQPVSHYPYNHPVAMSMAASSSSLAGAVSEPPPRRKILQPQPVRPIPPIPIDAIAASVELSYDTQAQQHHHLLDGESRPQPQPATRRPSQGLSPLSLLCQPLSNAFLDQLNIEAEQHQHRASSPPAYAY